MSKDIVIKTQTQLNKLKTDFDGYIYIEGGTQYSPLELKVAFEDARIIVRGEAWVRLWGSSHAVLRESSHVRLYGEAMVTAFSAKEIIARGYNVISVRKSNQKNITVVMNKDSYLKITPDFEPTFERYLKDYPVTIKSKKAILYKSVHKTKDGKYTADYDRRFTYKIGEKVTEICNQSTKNSCTQGLHVSHKSWARMFGMGWDDQAILECEVPIDKIVVSEDCDGKVRTSELKVIREVPKNEWVGE